MKLILSKHTFIIQRRLYLLGRLYSCVGWCVGLERWKEPVAGQGIVMVASSGLGGRLQSGGGCSEKCLKNKSLHKIYLQRFISSHTLNITIYYTWGIRSSTEEFPIWRLFVRFQSPSQYRDGFSEGLKWSSFVPDSGLMSCYTSVQHSILLAIVFYYSD